MSRPRPDRPPTRERVWRPFRPAAQTAALLLGCLAAAGGLTHAAFVYCPELAGALGGRRFAPPAGEDVSGRQMALRQMQKMQEQMTRKTQKMQKMRFVMAGGARLEVGAEAPDFTLPDASGRPVRLGSFRGKRPVVLVFGSFG